MELNYKVEDLVMKEGEYKIVPAEYVKPTLELTEIEHAYKLTYEGRSVIIRWGKLVELGIMDYMGDD